MIFDKLYYEYMKDYFHPNVRRHIEQVVDVINNDFIYLALFHCCRWKTRRSRKKSILYRNGNVCILGGKFHPGKLNVWKFRPLVQYTRDMSFVDENLNFYSSLRETIFIILRLENMILYWTLEIDICSLLSRKTHI